MATRKIGSRQLVVDGIAFRWRIRHRATYGQMDYGHGTIHVTVELAERPGTLLILYTDRPLHRPTAPCGLRPETAGPGSTLGCGCLGAPGAASWLEAFNTWPSVPCSGHRLFRGKARLTTTTYTGETR
jgi:hypothetical protein